MHLKSIDQIGFKTLIITTLIIFTSCSKKEQVTFYDKSLKSKKLTCLSFNPIKSGKLEKKLSSLYKFDKNCKNILNLSYKSQIVCNSPYNAPQKTTTNFPNAYLNLEVKRGFNLLYSYYIDLTRKPSASDVEDAFNRLKEDILK